VLSQGRHHHPLGSSLHIYCYRDVEDPGRDTWEDRDLLAWLVERGNSLTCIQGGYPDEVYDPLMGRAWRAGVFKSVKSVHLRLSNKEHRDLITDGVVSGVESINITLNSDFWAYEPPKVDQAALGCLRTFPALKSTKCWFRCGDTVLPPFIPPSLEALSLGCPGSRLLASMPPMLVSSGSRLRCLDLVIESLDQEHKARGVRGLLQACASSLKEVDLMTFATIESAAEVVEDLARCQHLERLTASLSTFAVGPPGGGITLPVMHLDLRSCLCDGDLGSRLSSLALWGLVARGGLPSLESLRLESKGWGWDTELGPAMVAAFEGVAGTLKELTLSQSEFDGAVGGREAEGVRQGVLWNLGEAIGKLCRLETLDLNLTRQGSAYYWIALGMGEGAWLPRGAIADHRHRAGRCLAGVSAQHRPTQRAETRGIALAPGPGRSRAAGSGLGPDKPRVQGFRGRDECSPRGAAARTDTCDCAAASPCQFPVMLLEGS
jgi:hypothetical protein